MKPWNDLSPAEQDARLHEVAMKYNAPGAIRCNACDGRESQIEYLCQRCRAAAGGCNITQEQKKGAIMTDEATKPEVPAESISEPSEPKKLPASTPISFRLPTEVVGHITASMARKSESMREFMTRQLKRGNPDWPWPK